MSTSDGMVGTATKVVDNGPGDSRWDLVVMGDGYRRSELPKFHDDVEQFWAEVLQPTPPFDQLWPAIKVHRVDVTSAQSGADMPWRGAVPDLLRCQLLQPDLGPRHVGVAIDRR